jgi:hypothetical protein
MKTPLIVGPLSHELLDQIRGRGLFVPSPLAPCCLSGWQKGSKPFGYRSGATATRTRVRRRTSGLL